MHIGVIFHQYVGGAVFQLIAMKFDTLVELICVINFAQFGVNRSHAGLRSGEQLNIRVLPLLEKPSLTLHGAAAHAVIVHW